MRSTNRRFCVKSVDFERGATLDRLGRCPDPEEWHRIEFNVVSRPRRGGRATYRIQAGANMGRPFPPTPALEYRLGRALEHGNVRRIEKDLPASVDSYRRAAEAGHQPAMYELAQAYERAIGVQEDHGEALKWYRRAAVEGYGPAQTAVGFFHYRGMGTSLDRKAAVTWYQLAAASGQTSAMHNLGHMYEDGVGVAESSRKAVEWFRKAAEAGHEESAEDMERFRGVSLTAPRVDDWLSDFRGSSCMRMTGAEMVSEELSISPDGALRHATANYVLAWSGRRLTRRTIYRANLSRMADHRIFASAGCWMLDLECAVEDCASYQRVDRRRSRHGSDQIRLYFLTEELARAALEELERSMP